MDLTDPSPRDPDSETDTSVVPPEDAALARFVRSGDADAFTAVYDELAPSLLRLASKLLRDPSAAEDALQATFLVALTSAARWDGRAVRPWMTGILANVVRNQRRSAARAPDLARLPSRPAPSDPADDAVHAELDRAVDETVRALPDAWQQPVLLRVREGLSAEQIAKLLDRPAGTIRSQLARGLARLRRGMASALAVFGGGQRTMTHPVDARLAAHASGAGAFTLGGVLMVKLAGLLLGAGVLGATAWFAWPTAGDEAPALGGPRAAQLAMQLDHPAATKVEQALAPPPVVAAVEPTPARDEPLEATPAPADDEVLGPFTVLVLDDGNRPVADAFVEVFGDDDRPEEEGFFRTPVRVSSVAQPRSSQVTDASGRCTVAPRADEVVAARHDVLGRSRLYAGDALQRGARAGLDEAVLILALPCRLTGRVLDARGVPLAGAVVKVSAFSFPTGKGEHRSVDELLTHDDGAFEVLVDAPTGFHLEARHDGRRSPIWSVRARAGEASSVDLVVPDTWVVEGTLVDADGSPRAGATVKLWQDGVRDELERAPTIDASTFERSTHADDHGAFRFEVARLGTWHLLGLPSADAGSSCALPLQPPRSSALLAFEPGDASSDVVDVVLSSGTPVQRVTLALRRAAPIHGTVVDGEGHPLAGHVVSARPSGASISPFSSEYGPDDLERFGLARGLTGADGAFLLDGLHPDGRFDLSTYADEHQRFVVARTEAVAAGADDVLIVVTDDARRAGVLEGRVLDAATGEPVPHFRIELAYRPEPNLLTSSERAFDDPDGRFRIDDLVPGRLYTPRVIPTTGHNVPDLPFEIMEDRTDLVARALDPFEASIEGRQVVVELPQPSSLVVELLDGGGAPVPHTMVYLAATQGQPGGRSWFRRTDERGFATFPDLEPMDFRVTATVAGQRVETAASVPPAGTARVSLRP